MKLTVSSTAMMRPILHTINGSPCSSPPQRVVGLLERGQLDDGSHCKSQKLVQYLRPEKEQVLLHTASWEDLLQIDNDKNQLCVAVFGYVFDGAKTWYQVWNNRTDRTCWLQHNDDMNYEPYAILAMDALVSLLPNWDGTLHQSPGAAINAKSPASQQSKTIDAKHVRHLLISDSSTSAAGKLWFLVTIKTTQKVQESKLKPISSKSGWISPTI